MAESSVSAPRTSPPPLTPLCRSMTWVQMYGKLKADRGGTSEAFNKLANANLLPGTSAHSDYVSCFRAMNNAGCRHLPMVVDRLKGHDLPSLKLLNTVLGNLKTTIAGANHALNAGWACATNSKLSA